MADDVHVWHFGAAALAMTLLIRHGKEREVIMSPGRRRQEVGGWQARTPKKEKNTVDLPFFTMNK